MESLLRALVLVGALSVPVTAIAQNAGVPMRSSTGAAAFVNGAVISNYDLDQRTALFAATSGVRPTEENLPQLRAQVLRSLEDEMIQLQEANKHRISVTKNEVDRALQNVAKDNNLTIPQMLNTLGQAGVSAATFAQQIGAQLIWQKVVTARYGTDVLISDQDVDEAMDRLRQGSDKPQFLLSEIYLGVDRSEDEVTIRASAEQFVQQIRQGVSFQIVASQFSQSPSAADGGDIGWVIQGQMAEEIDRALSELKPGQIAGPIRAEGGYHILLLRDRREPAGTNVTEAPPAPQADASAPLPLDRFLIPLPADADAMLKQRAMTLATNVASQVRTCADLAGIASQLQGTVYQRLGNMDPGNLDAQLRDALAKTVPGEVMKPFFSPAGLELIVRCDTASPGLRAFELPSREELRQQLFAQRMSHYAKSYLQELRRTAVVSKGVNRPRLQRVGTGNRLGALAFPDGARRAAPRLYGRGNQQRHQMRTLGRVRAIQKMGGALIVTAALWAGVSAAEPVAVRYTEGSVHGFLVLRSLDDQILADGDAIQTVRGDRVTMRVMFRFKDGSTHEETTVYSQRGQIQLISDRVVQKGPAFPRPIDMSVDGSTGQVTVRYQDAQGAPKNETRHFAVPPDLANGLVAKLLMNARPEAMPQSFSLMAATPTPRLVKLAVAPAGPEQFTIGGSPRNAMHYVLKVEVTGVAGVLAPIFGKQPPDSHVWIAGGEVPVFVRAEQPLYAGGPVWRIELASPTWPRPGPATAKASVTGKPPA
jgi:peptidyl-prolyl cis-trans isomerase SurA